MAVTLIQNKIYNLPGQSVMLDFDLAALYEAETRTMNQAVKRNIDRFPESFRLRLTKEEWVALIQEKAHSSSQNVMMNELPKNRTDKYLPYAFTEHGVTMLASVLKSKKAVAVNIAIVRAFVTLRKLSANYKELMEKMLSLEDKYDLQFLEIYAALNTLIKDNNNKTSWDERKRIGNKK